MKMGFWQCKDAEKATKEILEWQKEFFWKDTS